VTVPVVGTHHNGCEKGSETMLGLALADTPCGGRNAREVRWAVSSEHGGYDPNVISDVFAVSPAMVAMNWSSVRVGETPLS
jgi:hypothetical protein